MKNLDEATRLELIVEAVRYCQRVKKMEMSPACYSKALREPIYFLWERRRGGPKRKLVQYCSKESVGLRTGNGELVRDHAVPFKLLETELLALTNVTAYAVRNLLLKYEVCVLITKSENDRLNAAGLSSKMPAIWDGSDPLARYKAVGIDLVSLRPSENSL